MNNHLISFGILIFLLPCLFANSFGIGDFKDESAKSNAKGMKLLPYMTDYKGYGISTGGMLSLDEPEPGDKNSVHSVNLFYCTPKLNSNSSYSFKETGIEYENRTYDSPGSFTGVAFGVRQIDPDSDFDSWYKSKNLFAQSVYKPYASFRMGYKLMQNAPVFNTPAVVQLSYTLSDDYRFPSVGPNGYNKIPLKGIRLGMSFKF